MGKSLAFGTWKLLLLRVRGWTKGWEDHLEVTRYLTIHYLLLHTARQIHFNTSTQNRKLCRSRLISRHFLTKGTLLSCSIELTKPLTAGITRHFPSPIRFESLGTPEEKQQAGQGEKQWEFRKQIKEKGNKYGRADHLQLVAPAFIRIPESIIVSPALWETLATKVDFWLHCRGPLVLASLSAN